MLMYRPFQGMLQLQQEFCLQNFPAMKSQVIRRGGWLRELQEAEISSLGVVSDLEVWWDRPGQWPAGQASPFLSKH